jgi:hypothetical protein
MQRAWALFGKWAWLLLVATGVALVWKVSWESVSGGPAPGSPEAVSWVYDLDSEPWSVPPPL